MYNKRTKKKKIKVCVERGLTKDIPHGNIKIITAWYNMVHNKYMVEEK